MSFASMNAVNASRGMQGSKYSGPQGQSTQGPQAPVGSMPQVSGVSAYQQAGPQGLPPPPGPNGSQAYGMQATLPSQYVNRASTGPQGQGVQPQHAPGVVPGQQMPSAVPMQAPMKFDPNDPANAALAGYMAR